MQPNRCQAHARREVRRARSSVRIEARSRPRGHSQAATGVHVGSQQARLARHGNRGRQGQRDRSQPPLGLPLRALGSRIPANPARSYIASMLARLDATGRRAAHGARPARLVRRSGAGFRSVDRAPAPADRPAPVPGAARAGLSGRRQDLAPVARPPARAAGDAGPGGHPEEPWAPRSGDHGSRGRAPAGAPGAGNGAARARGGRRVRWTEIQEHGRLRDLERPREVAE